MYIRRYQDVYRKSLILTRCERESVNSQGTRSSHHASLCCSDAGLDIELFIISWPTRSCWSTVMLAGDGGGQQGWASGVSFVSNLSRPCCLNLSRVPVLLRCNAALDPSETHVSLSLSSLSSLSLSLSLSYTHTHTHTHSLSPSLSHTLALPLPLSHTHSLCGRRWHTRTCRSCMTSKTNPPPKASLISTSRNRF